MIYGVAYVSSEQRLRRTRITDIDFMSVLSSASFPKKYAAELLWH